MGQPSQWLFTATEKAWRVKQGLGQTGQRLFTATEKAWWVIGRDEEVGLL
jgi:hypothetical protein